MRSVGFRCVAVVCVLAAALMIAASAGRAVSGQNGGKVEVLPGFDVASIDRSASACQDFNQFANGSWIASNPIPAAYSRWGRFEMLAEQNNEQLHAILEGLAKQKNLKPGSNEQKLADFYSSCMDEPAIEAQGAKPLEPEMARIMAIKDLGGVEEEVARFHAHRIPALFGFGAAQDYKNSTAIIAQAVQGGLGLPNRDDYTEDKSKGVREEYVRHVARTFLTGADDPERAAAEVSRQVADALARVAP